MDADGKVESGTFSAGGGAFAFDVTGVVATNPGFASAIVDGAVAFTLPNKGANEWDAQFNHLIPTLKADAPYTICFDVKGTEDKVIKYSVDNNGTAAGGITAWDPIIAEGWTEVTLTADYQTVMMPVTSSIDKTDGRFVTTLAQFPGDVTFDNVGFYAGHLAACPK